MGVKAGILDRDDAVDFSESTEHFRGPALRVVGHHGQRRGGAQPAEVGHHAVCVAGNLPTDQRGHAQHGLDSQCVVGDEQFAGHRQISRYRRHHQGLLPHGFLCDACDLQKLSRTERLELPRAAAHGNHADTRVDQESEVPAEGFQIDLKGIGPVERRDHVGVYVLQLTAQALGKPIHGSIL